MEVSRTLRAIAMGGARGAKCVACQLCVHFSALSANVVFE